MPRRSKAPFAAAVVLFLAGAAVFAYPLISSWLAQKNQARVVQTYQAAVEAEDEAALPNSGPWPKNTTKTLPGTPCMTPLCPAAATPCPKITNRS